MGGAPFQIVAALDAAARALGYADRLDAMEQMLADGLPQKEIARRLGCSPAAVCRWRGGRAEERRGPHRPLPSCYACSVRRPCWQAAVDLRPLARQECREGMDD